MTHDSRVAGYADRELVLRDGQLDESGIGLVARPVPSGSRLAGAHAGGRASGSCCGRRRGMSARTLLRLALAGTRTDRLRVNLTAASAGLAVALLLTAATVGSISADGWGTGTQR